MRRLLALAVLAALLPAPAFANCAETTIDLQVVAPWITSAVAKLKAGPDGACFDRLAGSDLYLTAAFERLSPARKKALIDDAEKLFWREIPEKVGDQQRDSGAIALPVRFVDALGRELYVTTPCFGDFLQLTEHQRYLAMFSFGESNETTYRKQVHPLPKGLSLKQVRGRFHGVMSWKPAYYITWVPEGGFFEIDLPKDERRKLAAFWPKAPRGYRYDVRTNDGTLLGTVQR